MSEKSPVVWRDYIDAYIGQVSRVGFSNDGFVNATEPAKAFGKLPKDWLKTDRAREYMAVILRRYFGEKNPSVDSLDKRLVRIVNGTQGAHGTWLHHKLAIEFARWLSPDFAVWCDAQLEAISSFQGPRTADDLIDQTCGRDGLARFQSHRAQRGTSNMVAGAYRHRNDIINVRANTVEAATGMRPRVFHGAARSEGLTGDYVKSSLEYMRLRGMPHAPAIALANMALAMGADFGVVREAIPGFVEAFDQLQLGLAACGISAQKLGVMSPDEFRERLKRAQRERQEQEAQQLLFDFEDSEEN